MVSGTGPRARGRGASEWVILGAAAASAYESCGDVAHGAREAPTIEACFAEVDRPRAKILANTLGRRDGPAPIEGFAAEPCAGDLLLLTSAALPVADAALLQRVGAWRAAGEPLAALAPRIEAGLAEASEAETARDVSFVLARLTDASS